MLSTRPQTRSGRFWNSSGPGWIPYITNAPSITAVVPDPGTPSASSGTIAPAVAALFADSGPATPSIAPWPNRSGVRESRFSVAEERIDEIVAPAPGVTPIRKPITEPRQIG